MVCTLQGGYAINTYITIWYVPSREGTGHYFRFLIKLLAVGEFESSGGLAQPFGTPRDIGSDVVLDDITRSDATQLGHLFLALCK